MISNSPSKLVTAPIEVPSMATLAKDTGSLLEMSTTFPFIVVVLFFADAIRDKDAIKKKLRPSLAISFIYIFLFE